MTVHHTERVRIYVKDNALGLINDHKQKIWVSFSTFLRPRHRLLQNSDNNVLTRIDDIRGVTTVSVLILHLRSILNLGEEISLSLSVDDYILPENESLDVIHGNDIVVVELGSNKLPCDNAIKKKQKQKEAQNLLVQSHPPNAVNPSCRQNMELPVRSLAAGEQLTSKCFVATDIPKSNTQSSTKRAQNRWRRKKSNAGVPPNLGDATNNCNSSAHHLKTQGNNNDATTLQAKESGGDSLPQTSALSSREISEQKKYGPATTVVPPPTTNEPYRKKRRRRNSKQSENGMVLNDLPQVNDLKTASVEPQQQNLAVDLVIQQPQIQKPVVPSSSSSPPSVVKKYVSGTNCHIPSHNTKITRASTVERLLGKHVKFDSDGEEEDVSIGYSSNRVEVIDKEDYTAAAATECGDSISSSPVVGQQQKANMIALQNVHIGEEEMCDDVVSPRWKRPYEVIASINHRNLVTADDGKQHKYPNAKDVSSIERLQVGDRIAYKASAQHILGMIMMTSHTTTLHHTHGQDDLKPEYHLNLSCNNVIIIPPLTIYRLEGFGALRGNMVPYVISFC
eukprot:319751_1